MTAVLIIDADEGFANDLSGVLQNRGLDVQITGDGKAGLDLARINIPDAIVLCVELPRMSGYSICAKLKKDSTLKSVPLIITSAEATQETFEHHKKLKTRAEEYLKKPFAPDELMDVLGGLVTIEAAADEPIEELSIDDASPETLQDDEVFDAAEGSDMASIDQEIQNLSAGDDVLPNLGDPAGLQEENFDEEDVMTTVGVLPPGALDAPAAAAATAELEELRSQLAAEKNARNSAERERDVAVANEKATAAQIQKLQSSQPPTAASTGREVLELKKELNQKDRDILDLKQQLQNKESEVLSHRDTEMELEQKIVEAQEAQAEAESKLASSEAKLAAQEARAADLERSSQAALDDLNAQLGQANSHAAELDSAVQSLTQEMTTAKGLASALEQEKGEMERKLTDAEGQLHSARSDSDNLKTQLEATQDAVKGLNSEVADLKASLDSANDEINNLRGTLSENEDRLSRAYSKIREDEEVKAKAKKALEIASALLVEAGFTTDGDPPEDVDNPSAYG